MVNGNVISFHSYHNNEQYQIKKGDLIPELTSLGRDPLEGKGLCKKVGGPRLFAVDLSIFREYRGNVIPTILTANKPEMANAFERGEELRLENKLEIEREKIEYSAFLFLSVQYYSLED